MRRRLAALAPAGGHVVAGRIDAGRLQVGVVGEVERTVHEAAGQALGLPGVGPGQGAPLDALRRHPVQERVDAGPGQVRPRGEVVGGREIRSRIPTFAPAEHEVVAYRIDRDAVPARVEAGVDIGLQCRDLVRRRREIVRRRKAAAGREPDQRVAARTRSGGARPAVIQAVEGLQRTALTSPLGALDPACGLRRRLSRGLSPG